MSQLHFSLNKLILTFPRGAWAAQSVKRLTVNFGSSLDLRVVRSRPPSGCCWAWTLLEILSLVISLCTSSSHTLSK